MLGILPASSAIVLGAAFWLDILNNFIHLLPPGYLLPERGVETLSE